MKIEIWSDYICPFCYIGKRKIERAIEKFEHKNDIVIQYKSYELSPDATYIPGKSYHELLADKYNMTTEKAKQMNENIRLQASENGLEYDFDLMQPTNTFDAHRIAKLAAKENKGQEMTERLFKAYFTEGLLISDHNTLRRLANDVGVDAEKVNLILESRKLSSHVRDDEEQAAQIGVQGVPFFVLNETYAVSGAQPIEVFIEIFNKVWEEEHKNPALKSLMPKNSKTSYCTGEGCGVDKD